jgi:hypothetical protein
MSASCTDGSILGDQLLLASEVRMTIWLMLIIIAVLLVGLCLVLWFGPKEWDGDEMWRP